MFLGERVSERSSSDYIALLRSRIFPGLNSPIQGMGSMPIRSRLREIVACTSSNALSLAPPRKDDCHSRYVALKRPLSWTMSAGLLPRFHTWLRYAGLYLCAMQIAG